jgi:hypothetical protein
MILTLRMDGDYDIDDEKNFKDNTSGLETYLISNHKIIEQPLNKPLCPRSSVDRA